MMSFYLAVQDAETDFRTPLQSVLSRQNEADPDAFLTALADFTAEENAVLGAAVGDIGNRGQSKPNAEKTSGFATARRNPKDFPVSRLYENRPPLTIPAACFLFPAIYSSQNNSSRVFPSTRQMDRQSLMVGL